MRRLLRQLGVKAVVALSVGLGVWTGAAAQRLIWLGGRSDAAYSVSADGRVVVGAADEVSGQYRAFRWENGVMQDLGAPRGSWSVAFDVSADGHVVVGLVENANGLWYAFQWAEGQGMQDLNQAFASLLTDGSRLLEAHAVSVDGRYIVGEGLNMATRRWEAFLLDTWREGDTNGDGCINNADLLAVLFAFGTPGTGYTRHEDINKDGIVNNDDLLLVLFNFGQGC